LRACGVLETVRISAVGYPSRLTYQEFFQRFHELINSKQINNQSLKEKCEAILIDLKKYQFGKTKIFFQEGQLAYLEKLKSDKLKSCSIMIQKHFRGWLSRSKYVKIKRLTEMIIRFQVSKMCLFVCFFTVFCYNFYTLLSLYVVDILLERIFKL